MDNITGTDVNYYILCKRKCFLSHNKIGLEQNSELVKIGKVLHEQKYQNDNASEKLIECIKIDKISKDYVSELKKSDSDIESAKWQLLYYLYILKQKGIYRKGKLEFIQQNNQKNKIIYIELTDANEKELIELLKDISELFKSDKIPCTLNNRKCKKCAYYDYCYI